MTHPAYVREDCTVKQETLQSLRMHWDDEDSRLQWPSLFSTPVWIDSWHSCLECSETLCILTVYRNGSVIGLAPMTLANKATALIGDPDVFDFLDFAVAPDRGAAFVAALVDHFRAMGINRIDLISLREDSIAFAELTAINGTAGIEVTLQPAGSCYAMALPQTWDGYLDMLNQKQRHEIRRKLRRLEEAAPFTLRTITEFDQVRKAFPDFLNLFRMSRADKAAFMTDDMAAFFYRLLQTAAKENMLRLYFLDIDERPVATALCFDYQSTTYLYNSGYNTDYSSLSAGLICEILSIRDSIERGNRCYDFLKGDELYKQRLGGKPVPLYRCCITLE